MPAKSTPKSSLKAGAGALYQKIKERILERIQSGEFDEGERLPTEKELVAEFGVARMTVHRALSELTREGHIVRVQGVGSFVAERKAPESPLLEIGDIAEDIRRRGHEHASRVIALASVAPPARVREALKLVGEKPLYHSEIVHFEEGVAVMFEDRYVKPQFARDYLKQDFTAITPYRYLQSCGAVTMIRHTLWAKSPAAKIRRQLGIDKDDACLLLRRLTWSGDSIVTFSEFYYPGSRYQLSSQYSPE